MKPMLFFILIFCGGITRAQKINYAPAFRENFNTRGMTHFRYGSSGSKAAFKWQSGVASRTDTAAKVLRFKIDPMDRAGAGRGPEIISREFTCFGSYSARLKVPDVKEVQPNTGAVIGYFTHYMDSVYGLSEIDFEWLVADPAIIYIGTWTGSSGKLKRIGRTLNLAKGIVYNTIYKEGFDGEPTDLTLAQNQPETLEPIENYDASARFYTYGFDWQADRLTWWLLHPVSGKKIILWDYQGSARGLPQYPSYYRMNFWHTKDWAVETNPKSLEKPAHPFELEVDWMSYDPLPK